MKLLLSILLVFPAGLWAAAASPASAVVVITAAGEPIAGTPFCVNVVVTGSAGALTVVATVAGQRVTATVTPQPNGSYQVCVPLGASDSGKLVRITAVAGDAVKSGTFTIG